MIFANDNTLTIYDSKAHETLFPLTFFEKCYFSAWS